VRGQPLPVAAFGSIGAGASLIALLQYLANRGSDRLLISLRHCRDHRSELAPGYVRAQPNRVFLEGAAPTFKQSFEVYAVLLDETANLPVPEAQNRLDLFVGKIAGCGNFPDALPHSLFELAPLLLPFVTYRN
jgi:hypothetical protein